MQSRKRTVLMKNLSWICASIKAANINKYMNEYRKPDNRHARTLEVQKN